MHRRSQFVIGQARKQTLRIRGIVTNLSCLGYERGLLTCDCSTAAIRLRWLVAISVPQIDSLQMAIAGQPYACSVSRALSSSHKAQRRGVICVKIIRPACYENKGTLSLVVEYWHG
jgi:hypothetical protein